MVQTDPVRLPGKADRQWAGCVQAILVVLVVCGVVVTAIAWFLPVEVFQSWAFERAGTDDYRRFESIARAELACWLVRFASPLLTVIAFRRLRKLTETATLIANALGGLMAVTSVNHRPGHSFGWRTICFRIIVLAWAFIELGNAGQAIYEEMTRWAYFRFRSGSQVLPNISDSNRDVIRYLQQAAEPGSRIFVASDQKLYFLQYYLLPRRLYYKPHPDSEFAVAQPFQQRRMEAFPLAEIETSTIDRIDPDYILEYFEHPDYVDRNRLHDDPAWLSFYRTIRHDPQAGPNFVVSLRRTERNHTP